MELNLALLTIGGVVLVLGLLSGWMRRTVLSEPAIAIGVGVLLGPEVTGLLDVNRWGEADQVLREATRLTLAISVMSVALRLPRGQVGANGRAIGTLLGLVMLAMWAVSAGLALLVLGCSLSMAALIGAVITPTDPVVATAIVTGGVATSNLPARIRNVISAESGANDGLALPFVAVAILWLNHDQSLWSDWLLGSLLREVGGALLFGSILGFAAGRFLEWALARRKIETTSHLAYTLALSLVAIGGASLLGLNEILAVFVTGLSFDNAVREKDRLQEENVQESINRFFVLPVFVLLGLALPWREWMQLGWRGLVLACSVILLRRPPAVLLLKPLLGTVSARADALFIGWFGPIGVAALYYALHAKEKTGAVLPWAVATLVVVASVLVHGTSAAPLTKLYGRRGGRAQAEAQAEENSD